MNKVLIVALAVCLVSVHAFVKRDAEKTETNTLDDLKKRAEDMGKQVTDFFNSDQVKDVPENIKKGFEDVMEALKKAFDTKTEATEKKE